MDDLVHGGALGAMMAAFPDAPLPWIDLSTGINPWSYPVGQVAPEMWRNLPDRAATDACEAALANVAGCSVHNIVLTSGSSAAMAAVATALSIRHVAVLQPTYGGYRQAFGQVEAMANLKRAVASNAQAIILGNPNNPDGLWQDADDVQDIAGKLAGQGRWLIIDEAFGDVAPDTCVSALAGIPGLLVLRSFGKFYGLAGLRLGAVLGPTLTIQAISDQLGPWPVSGPALEIGKRAYADIAWQKQMRICLYVEAAALRDLLVSSGCGYAGGTPLFALVTTPDAHALWDKLGRAGIYVRRFDWSNQFLRFGLPADNAAFERLKSALQT